MKIKGRERSEDWKIQGQGQVRRSPMQNFETRDKERAKDEQPKKEGQSIQLHDDQLEEQLGVYSNLAHKLHTRTSVPVRDESSCRYDVWKEGSREMRPEVRWARQGFR